MQLQYIFKSDITRDINGVIKVAQDDKMREELEEYIITRELHRHFHTFLTNYEQSITVPTDKIGVWISGFFGSGKSHFLKMLSYLLSNRTVDGKGAVTYFADKFDDPAMFARLERCAAVPTETILFNIDSKSPINKDKTAILRVFAKVFYEHQGFYGNDLKVARLERFVAKSGKWDAFLSAFEEVNGDTWDNARDAFAFFEDDIVEVLMSTLDMSETAARNWFNGTEQADISIEQLVGEIKEYVESRGQEYRLLFMIDEVGQYIGSDSHLMLNLQTIVEEIGTRCDGRVWVMVTSQEAIDSITKISGDDFSKIQGRFNTRLSLTSSSVDEVIKKRILAKTEDATRLLGMSYAQNSAILKNLFTFRDAVLDLKGYASETEFIQTYPFVPYQFRLMQNVLAQIRKHGNSGKHLSGGERSMLSGFQEAAQAIKEKDEHALVPFSLFYNTVHTFLESTIRRVIDRCQTAADQGDGMQPYDVEILKLLYLIRYVEDIKANVDNITTLMVEDMRADKMAMRQKVQESLDRLLSQNYIARSGDTYAFLTDDEQDIAREIRSTVVDSAAIVQSIAQIVFGTLYLTKKFNYDGVYNVPFDQFVDETAIGTPSGSIRLRVVTVASDLHTADPKMLVMKSGVDNEAIVVLSDQYPYFDEIEQAMKIRKFVKGRNVTQLPETIQSIIRARQQQASAHEKQAREYLTAAILSAVFYVGGERITVKGTTVKEKLDEALSWLVEGVYTKLRYVRRNYKSDEDLRQLLVEGAHKTDDGISPNEEAVREVEQFLKLQQERMLPTSMGDIQRRYQAIPYGWREIDVAAVVAELIVGQKVMILYGGSTIQPSDRRLPEYLTRRSDVDKALVKRREVIPDRLLKQSREFLREYFNTMDIPMDEDGLIAFVIERFKAVRETLMSLLAKEYADGRYPGKPLVEAGIALCDALLSQQKDNVALLTKMVNMEDDWLDHSDDMSAVRAFFANQRAVFDSAAALYEAMVAEREYLQAEVETMHCLSVIRSVLDMPSPYARINELPMLMQTVRATYSHLLAIKRDEVFADIQAAMAEIHQTASVDQKAVVAKADDALAAKRTAADRTDTLTALDAMKIQIVNIRLQYLKVLMAQNAPDEDSVSVSRAGLGYAAKLRNEADIDHYLADVKERLMTLLDGHDVLQIL